ncbi:hypothetical protein B566_EDAN014409 [Ephemera danica]|nr:hypothetical protein B566_EDAN014409 [Ephemera danica]
MCTRSSFNVGALNSPLASCNLNSRRTVKLVTKVETMVDLDQLQLKWLQGGAVVVTEGRNRGTTHRSGVHRRTSRERGLEREPCLRSNCSEDDGFSAATILFYLGCSSSH